MELRDYLRMLRRGWPVVLLVTAASVGLAVAYLTIAPKRYETTAVVLVSAGAPESTTDLQLGLQYAVNVAPTYADIVHSPEVLGPVAEQLMPSRSIDQLEDIVAAGARESTALIDITATAGGAREAANIANSVATTAVHVIPSLTPRGAKAPRSMVTLQVVRMAPEPETALSPDTSRTLALGVVIGLALGLATTLASQALDTRLHRPGGVRELTSAPLLAMLPRISRSQRSRIVVRDDPGSPVVEAYRTLRTNLVHLESGERRSLLFVGVGHREGPEVPVNLAWSIAQAGRRVLLVDLDLRQSAVGDLLHLRVGTGMADVLAEKVDLAQAIQPTGQTGLDVVLSGTPQPSPSDLLSSPLMERILLEAEADYDYVVLHTPPLLAYTDAAVVSRVTGQTLVTVRAGRTKAAELTAALDALQNVRVAPLGVVLVGARPHIGDMNKLHGGGRGRNHARPERVPRLNWDWNHVEPPVTQERP